MKKCPKCEGKGNYVYHHTLEELRALSSYGGTTNYNPDYTKTCEKCKGKGKIKCKKNAHIRQNVKNVVIKIKKQKNVK